MNSLPAWQIAGFVTLHSGALVCALGTRVAAGSRYEPVFQFLFLPVLAAVGLATWYCRSEGIGIGVPSGVTLIAMVLVAVTDLRHAHESAGSRALSSHR